MKIKTELRYMLEEFWDSDFNKALLISVIVFTVVLIFFFVWTAPVISLLYLVLLFRLKGFKKAYPNKWYLIIFICVSLMLTPFKAEFILATGVLTFALLLPEHWWNFIVGSK